MGAPWEGGPLIINPIYILYSGYLLGISPFKGLLRGFKQLGYHPKGTTIFPMRRGNEKKYKISNCSSEQRAAKTILERTPFGEQNSRPLQSGNHKSSMSSGTKTMNGNSFNNDAPCE